MDAGGGRRLRLFAAVAVPDRHKESVAESVAPLKALLPGARWTKPATWHVTLKFFGEVPEGRLDDLQQGIGRALVGEPAVESRLQDVGAFPNLKRARVLWAGIEDSRLMLTRFAERIEAECGFPEDRALHPHLTLAPLEGAGGDRQGGGPVPSLRPGSGAVFHRQGDAFSVLHRAIRLTVRGAGRVGVVHRLTAAAGHIRGRNGGLGAYNHRCVVLC